MKKSFEDFKFKIGELVSHRIAPLMRLGVVCERILAETDAGISLRYSVIGPDDDKPREFSEFELTNAG